MLGFLTTIGGMLVFALMIGVVSESIGARVDDLKRGNSKASARRAAMRRAGTVGLAWMEGGGGWGKRLGGALLGLSML